ncbi:MAG: Crp/Fnr family transcriptional regulator [Bacilli bacterium]
MKQYCKNCIYKILPFGEKEYEANQTIFLEGDLLRWVYRIKTGYVKMYRLLESGDERILSIFGPGDFIALLAVLQNQTHYIAFATALTPLHLQVIDKQAVKKAYQSNNLFKDNCINCAITRTHFFQFQMTQVGNNDTEDKIINILQNLHKKFGYSLESPKLMVLPFSKTVLADIIGIRRETLSRHLSLMETKGILKVEKNRYILL